MNEEGMQDLFDDELTEEVGEKEQEEGAEVSRDQEGADVEEHDLQGAAHKVLPDPGEPTAAEVEDHRACGHLPYRSWCDECVEARGTGEPHRKRTEQREVCVFAFDYLFIGKDGLAIRRQDLTELRNEVAVKILIARDTRGKAAFAHVIPRKGVDEDHYSVDVLVKDVQWLGFREIVLKSDNEPAILNLLNHALTEIRIDTKMDQITEEHPTVYDPSGNGDVEAAVKQFQGVLRTNKRDLEKRMGAKVPVEHPLFGWLVEYCAFIINIRIMGKDGITAFARVRRKSFAKRLIPFGELVLVHMPRMSPERQKQGVLEPRAIKGVILGYGRQSHSYAVYVDGEIKYVRSVARLPLSRRWQVDALQDVAVTVQDQHLRRGAKAVPFTDREAPRADEHGYKRAPRRLELRQADFDPTMGGFGWTEHCPKCSRARLYGWRDSVNLQHSEACRQRIEGELAATAKGQARLELSKTRVERRKAAAVAEDPLVVHDKEEEKAAAAAEGPRENFEDLAIPQPAPVLQPRPAGDRATGDNHPRRGAAPPEKAKVAPSSSPAEVMSSDDEEEWEDIEGGQDAPMTPENPSDAYTPTTPRSTQSDHEPMTMGHLQALKVQDGDEDVKPAAEVISSREGMLEDMLESNLHIMEVLAQLGGNPKKYRRERSRAVKAFVSEIYSAPRVTNVAKLLPGLGLLPGFALDLTTVNEQGHNWDFTQEKMRREARRKVATEKPMFLIGSPACTAYCSWQALNAVKHEWPEGERERRMIASDVHLKFVAELYDLQMKEGRYFLHENPEGAKSWEREPMMDLAKNPKVSRIVGDQCQYGQQSYQGAPVKKGTGWMSNSPEILKKLERRCRGTRGECSRPGGGRHATASGRVAREAAVYPFRLCRAILEGCRNQLRRDGRLVDGVHGYQGLFDEDVAPLLQPSFYDAFTGERLSGEEGVAAQKVFQITNKEVVYKDSVTGQPLERSLVHAARKLELEYFEAKEVWVRRPRAEALAKTGKSPISVRWIDTNKGDDDSPNYRSRLVAREIRKRGENPIFAPTPPLESLRTVISLAASDVRGMPRHVRAPNSMHRTQVSFIDISRAYFCAATDPDDPTYVELPTEDPEHGTMVGKLLKHMYGTRKAADGWHNEYAGRLVQSLQFEVGDASACVFFHKSRNLRCSVHGDDITTVGSKANLDWFKSKLEEFYELKEAARLGPAAEDDKEATVLNRVVRWTPQGLEMEADPRQAEKLLRDLKLDGEGVKTAASPGSKATREQLDGDAPLEASKCTPYRAVVARANYLASDRPELQFAAKEVCRWMSAPTDLSLAALKRLGRFVKDRQRLVYFYPWQDVDRVDTYSDTDWAGCLKTRKSTSGGCLMLGAHLIKSWSSTQSSVSLSSGEAEFYGVVKASGVSLGYQALLKDVGLALPIRVWTDSTATMGICGRQGLGKLRHVDTQCLWIQQRVRDGSVELRKVRGEENPADLFTKHLTSRDRIEGLLDLFGCRHQSGRAAAAPVLRSGAGTSKGELLKLAEASTGTMPWHGRVFPRSADGESDTPEALPAQEGVLPHLHSDQEDRFPRAVACDATTDRDPDGEDGLEDRGRAIGIGLGTACGEKEQREGRDEQRGYDEFSRT